MDKKSVLRWARLGQGSAPRASFSLHQATLGWPWSTNSCCSQAPTPRKGPHPSSPESRCYSLLPHQPLKMCCPFQLRPSLFSCSRLLRGECPPTLLAPSCVESSPPAGLDVTFSLPDTCSVLPWLALERAEVSVSHPSPH